MNHRITAAQIFESERGFYKISGHMRRDRRALCRSRLRFLFSNPLEIFDTDRIVAQFTSDALNRPFHGKVNQ